MPKYDLLIKDLEEIRSEVLAAGNPYVLSDAEKHDFFLVTNTLVFIVRHIDILKSKKDTYFPADPGDTGEKQVSKYVYIHFEQTRERAEQAIDHETKKETPELSSDQHREQQIQNAVEYILVEATAQLFVQSIRALKTHQAKIEAKVADVNLVKTFCQKLQGICLDARTRSAFKYALTITEGPRFSELFNVDEKAPKRFRYSYFGTYAIVLKLHMGRTFRADEKHPLAPETQICDREGIFATNDVVSGFARRVLTGLFGLDPMKPEIASTEFPNDVTHNVLEDPYDHFVLAFQELQTEELKNHLVRFLLSHGTEFVNEFLSGFQKRFIDTQVRQSCISYPLVIPEIAIRLGQSEWIVRYLMKENTHVQGQVLTLAAKRRDTKVFLAIIDAGYSLTEQQLDGLTPIQLAAWTDCWDLVSDLIDRLPPTILDEKDRAHCGDPLLRAAQNRKWHDDIFKKLIIKAKAYLYWFTPEGYSVLHFALLEEDFLPIAKLLLDSGASINAQGLSSNPANPAPIHVVAKRKEAKVDALQWVLEQKADIECKDSNGDTALMMAAESGQLDKVIVLLKHGAKQEGKNKKGNSAFMLAAVEGHTDVVREFMQRGATTKQLFEFNCDRKHVFDVLAEKRNWVAFSALVRLYRDDLRNLLTLTNAKGQTIIEILSLAKAWEYLNDILDMNPPSDPRDEAHFGFALELAGRLHQWKLFRRIANETHPNLTWYNPLNGCSAIHHSLFEPEGESKEESLLQLLIRKDSEIINLQSKQTPNPTPLHVAARKDVPLKKFQFLLEQKNIDLERLDGNNNTPLMFAAEHGDPVKVAMLLKELLTRKPNADLDPVNLDGHSAILLAGKCGQVDAVQALVRAGVSPSRLCLYNNSGKNAFDMLAEAGKWTAFSTLIRIYHAHIPNLFTNKNTNGLTLIQLASLAGAWDCVNEIVDLCPPDPQDEMHTGDALRSAALGRNWALAKKIIKLKATTTRNTGTSYTWRSRDYGYFALHEALLEKKEEYKDESLAQQLLDAGADVNAQHKTNLSWAPIHLAAAFEEVEPSMLQLLLDHKKIKVNIEGYGKTALHLAIHHGRVEKAKLILAHSDCDIERKQPDGKTAIDLARESKNPEMAALFTSDAVKFKLIKNRINREQYTEASELLLEIYNNDPQTFKSFILALQYFIEPTFIDDKTVYQKLLDKLIPIIAKQLILNNDIEIIELLLKNCGEKAQKEFESISTIMQAFAEIDSADALHDKARIFRQLLINKPNQALFDYLTTIDVNLRREFTLILLRYYLEEFAKQLPDPTSIHNWLGTQGYLREVEEKEVAADQVTFLLGQCKQLAQTGHFKDSLNDYKNRCFTFPDLFLSTMKECPNEKRWLVIKELNVDGFVIKHPHFCYIYDLLSESERAEFYPTALLTIEPVEERAKILVNILRTPRALDFLNKLHPFELKEACPQGYKSKLQQISESKAFEALFNTLPQGTQQGVLDFMVTKEFQACEETDDWCIVVNVVAEARSHPGEMNAAIVFRDILQLRTQQNVRLGAELLTATIKKNPNILLDQLKKLPPQAQENLLLHLQGPEKRYFFDLLKNDPKIFEELLVIIQGNIFLKEQVTISYYLGLIEKLENPVPTFVEIFNKLSSKAARESFFDHLSFDCQFKICKNIYLLEHFSRVGMPFALIKELLLFIFRFHQEQFVKVFPTADAMDRWCYCQSIILELQNGNLTAYAAVDALKEIINKASYIPELGNLPSCITTQRALIDTLYATQQFPILLTHLRPITDKFFNDIRSWHDPNFYAVVNAVNTQNVKAIQLKMEIINEILNNSDIRNNIIKHINPWVQKAVLIECFERKLLLSLPYVTNWSQFRYHLSALSNLHVHYNDFRFSEFSWDQKAEHTIVPRNIREWLFKENGNLTPDMKFHVLVNLHKVKPKVLLRIFDQPFLLLRMFRLLPVNVRNKFFILWIESTVANLSSLRAENKDDCQNKINRLKLLREKYGLTKIDALDEPLKETRIEKFFRALAHSKRQEQPHRFYSGRTPGVVPEAKSVVSAQALTFTPSQASRSQS